MFLNLPASAFLNNLQRRRNYNLLKSEFQVTLFADQLFRAVWHLEITCVYHSVSSLSECRHFDQLNDLTLGELRIIRII